jgi:hypothetical protein
VWVPPVVLSWLIPGGGHFLLGKRGRGAMLAGATLLTFALGLLLRGAFFEPQTADLLTTIIYVGGNLANKCAGLLYFLAHWMGYNQPDVAGHVHDYGTKFLVGAGLMNVLAMMDAFEIATKRKE